MEARYSKIHSDEEVADTARASARAEVAEYEGQLASVRAEAYERVNAARRTLEAERTERLAAVNTGIDERRREAMAAAADDRAAVRGDVEAAAADVLARTVELAIGTDADAGAVRDAVSASMMEGAGR
jgi:F-type H+-transporting ATPase subunit b